jgi:hypothetical protein
VERRPLGQESDPTADYRCKAIDPSFRQAHRQMLAGGALGEVWAPFKVGETLSHARTFPNKDLKGLETRPMTA